MPDKVPIKNLNGKDISPDAQKLIDEAVKVLGYSLNWNTAYRIDSDEKTELEKLDTVLNGAKIIVHKDGKGAIIVSSTGAVVNVGEEYSNKSYSSMSDQQKSDYDATFDQSTYAFGEATDALYSGEVISPEEKEKLEKLNKALKHIVIMVTDDGKGVSVADDNGLYFAAGTSDKNPGIYVGDLTKLSGKQK